MKNFSDIKLKFYSDEGPSMTPTTDMGALKDYVPYDKLKLYPTPMVGIVKGNVHPRVIPGCKIFYLKDSNRPYCED